MWSLAQLEGTARQPSAACLKETFMNRAYQWMLKKKCEDIQNDLTTTEMSISDQL